MSHRWEWYTNYKYISLLKFDVELNRRKKNEETYMAIDMNMQYVGICSAFHSRYRRAESNYYIDDIYIILEKNEQNFQKILHSEHSKNWMTINQSCFVLFSFRCVFCVI